MLYLELKALSLDSDTCFWLRGGGGKEMLFKGKASLPLPPLGDSKPVGEQLVPMG